MFAPSAYLNIAKDLITHLLCVDPTQRYSIDEFLAHPWCHEAPAPPPPPTPLNAPLLHRAIDSPLLQSLRGGREARSPGLHTLKEAFDITYAVHRMEEEGRRQGRGAGGRGFLQGLNEDDEEEVTQDGRIVQEAQKRQREAEARQANLKGRSRSKPRDDLQDAGRAGMRDAPRHRDRIDGSKPFELDIDGATLLGRRHRKGPRNAAASSPLAQQIGREDSPFQIPGSPMHIG